MKSHVSKIAALAILASSTYAAEFTSIGQLSTSIGGAGVAVKNSPFSIYYNPALLGVGEKSGFAISAGLSFSENNLSNNIETLSNSDLDSLKGNVVVTGNGTGNSLSSDNQRKALDIQNSIKSLAEGNRLSVGPSVGIVGELGNYGFGIILQGSATASAIFDGDRTEFIFKDSGNYAKYDPTTNTYSTSNQTEYEAKSFEYALDNNLTYIKISGVAIAEAPFGYGTKINSDLGDFYLGGAVKVMSGTTFSASPKLNDKNFDDQIEDGTVTSADFGIDVGMYLEPTAMEGLGLGLVAKNVNTPTFDVKGGGELKVEPQIRAGLSYDIFENLTFALDADLTKNDLYVNNLESQYVGGGINFHPGDSFSLRAGAKKDIAEDESSPILTGGLSVGLFGATFDLGAQVATDTSKTSDGDDIPKYVQLNVGLNVVW